MRYSSGSRNKLVSKLPSSMRPPRSQQVIWVGVLVLVSVRVGRGVCLAGAGLVGLGNSVAVSEGTGVDEGDGETTGVAVGKAVLMLVLMLFAHPANPRLIRPERMRIKQERDNQPH